MFANQADAPRHSQRGGGGRLAARAAVRRLALCLLLALLSGACPAAAAPPGMALVPGGWFTMGCKDGEADARPPRRVWLDAFYMDTREVTKAEFARYLNANDGDRLNRRLGQDNFGITFDGRRFAPLPGRGNEPAVCVTWREADRYCAWRGKELPSEAQWEKAARAGRTGLAYGHLAELGPDAAVVNTLRKRPAPVASRPPNPYGLYDMLGNAQEMCRDHYDPKFYRHMPLDNPVQTRGKGPEGRADRRVVRGGSFSLPAGLARVCRRYFISERLQETYGFVGFRCSCRPPHCPPPQGTVPK